MDVYLLWMQEVAGSSPVSLTIKNDEKAEWLRQQSEKLRDIGSFRYLSEPICFTKARKKSRNLCSTSPTGRGGGLRNLMFQVRVLGGVLEVFLITVKET